MNPAKRRGRGRILGAITVAVALAQPFVTAPSGMASEGAILGADAPDVIPDRYIVSLKDKTGEVSAKAEHLASTYGGKVKFTYEHAMSGFSVVMPEKRARKLAADRRVEYVEQVGMARIADTQNNPPWGLDRIDQRDRPLSDSYTYPDHAGSGVTVYVIDTGTRQTHRDFTGRISAGRDFIDNDNNANDCNGHGTHVAGSAAGSTYGVAKQARIVPIRVLDCQGSGPWDVVIAGVDYVTGNASGPSVANMSLGGNGSNTSLENAVRRSISSGVSYALAAGNSGADACNFTPARVSEAITVGNSTSSDARYIGTGTSNYGRCLDLFAPGTNITSAWHTSDTATNSITGTSMASPHVAGAAALYLSANTNATPQQVRDALVDNASSGKLTSIGSGSPNLLLYTDFLNGDPDPGNPSVTNPGDQESAVDEPVRLQLRASGGTTPYEWGATGLPAGLSIDSSSGLISGTPTTEGTSKVTVTVTDAEDVTDSASFSWTISSTGGGGCSGHEFTVDGTLSSGDAESQPGGRYYYSGSSGNHAADLCGPDGADFDIYLQKWSGYGWSTVDRGITPGNEESISYSGTAGYYRYVVHAYSGSGDYTLGYTNP